MSKVETRMYAYLNEGTMVRLIRNKPFILHVMAPLVKLLENPQLQTTDSIELPGAIVSKPECMDGAYLVWFYPSDYHLIRSYIKRIIND